MEKRKWTKEEVSQYRAEHGILFYFNKEDANLFVPKAFGIGFTLNWANPISWIVTAALAVLIVWVVSNG